MIYIIGYKGYIGSNLMLAFPEAKGIGRGDEWAAFCNNDFVINCASYFWHGKEYCDYWARKINHDIPEMISRYDTNVIQLTSEAAYKEPKEPMWKHKAIGDEYIMRRGSALILPTVYGGINQHPHMFMTGLLNDPKFKLETPDEERDFVHIDVVIDTIKRIIKGETGGMIQLTSGQRIKMSTMTQITQGITTECLRNQTSERK